MIHSRKTSDPAAVRADPLPPGPPVQALAAEPGGRRSSESDASVHEARLASVLANAALQIESATLATLENRKAAAMTNATRALEKAVHERTSPSQPVPAIPRATHLAPTEMIPLRGGGVRRLGNGQLQILRRAMWDDQSCLGTVVLAPGEQLRLSEILQRGQSPKRSAQHLPELIAERFTEADDAIAFVCTSGVSAFKTWVYSGSSRVDHFTAVNGEWKAFTPEVPTTGG